jgi:hypothetical protein
VIPVPSLSFVSVEPISSIVPTHEVQAEYCDDRRGRFVPASSSCCEHEPGDCDAVGVTKAAASARTSIASSISSACLILPSATTASASLPRRSNSTTSRRLIIFCLWACCLVTPWGAAYVHGLSLRSQALQVGRSPEHYQPSEGFPRNTAWWDMTNLLSFSSASCLFLISLLLSYDNKCNVRLQAVWCGTRLRLVEVECCSGGVW